MQASDTSEKLPDAGMILELSHSFAEALPELAVPWSAIVPELPTLVQLNHALAREFSLDPRQLRADDGLRALLGNDVPDGAQPVAQAYAGHQFGGYAPRLGDGRALLLGELRDSAGGLRDLHLKGSGPTPFARSDGFAAIGPMLREYVLGEAMHALGIPTTRALAVIDTGRRVRRDAELLPGAILVRTASSHLRVGTFQYARATGDIELLRRLVEFALKRHAPDRAIDGSSALALLDFVIEQQAVLIARWMHVGFVHGVMNTDNMTISGETIDYGPCAFMDVFDPTTVFSSIDHGGRYSYGNQPGIAQWNLARFAESLLPLIDDDESRAVELAEGRIARFVELYQSAWLAGMREKLGLADAQSQDAALVQRILEDLRASRLDYTSFFRALATAARGDQDQLRALYGETAHSWPRDWMSEWRARAPDAELMDRVNPVYIARNHLVDEALNAATAGDLVPLERLLEVLRLPFSERADRARYADPAPQGSWPGRTYCGT